MATKFKNHRGFFVTGTDFTDDLCIFGMTTISDLGFIYDKLPRGIIPRFSENSIFIITDKDGNPDPFEIVKGQDIYKHENGNALRIYWNDDAPPVQQDVKSTEKPLSESERTTLLKMIYGMAIDGYGFNPEEKKPKLTGQTSEGLAAQLLGVGIDVSYKSVKRHIDAAKELLESERKSQCTQKKLKHFKNVENLSELTNGR